MADIIQIFSLAVLALSTLYCMALLRNSVRIGNMYTLRENVERENIVANTNEILERNRITQAKEAAGWNGTRKFLVSKKVLEAKDQCSFYFSPHDGRKLPPFEPGQFLTFRLDIPGQKKQTIRCYSLSDSPKSDYYRCTIKRVPPPRDSDHAPGLSSNYFHDFVEEGKILDVRAPGGHFYLDTKRQTPVVLIGGGIGLTPVLSMVNHIIDTGSKRETWFFYGVTNGVDHAMKEHLEKIDADHEHINICIVYSKPRDDEDTEGKDYKYSGRVGVDLFKKVLPSNNFDYYFCGPPPMMNSLFEGLREWGVPEEKIHYEAFGPATVSKKKDADKAADKAPAAASDAAASDIKITFSQSDKTIAWSADAGSLLEFAEDNDIPMDSGCRAGNCGTCVTAITDGEVEYLSEPGDKPDSGTCLTCISVPKNSMTLDA